MVATNDVIGILISDAERDALSRLAYAESGNMRNVSGTLYA